MAYADYIEMFENVSEDIEKIFAEYGDHRAIQKMYGALDAIVLKLTRVNPCKPFPLKKEGNAA